MLKSIKDSGEPGVLVAFSGGKDSWAVLQMAVDTFGHGNVRGIFCWLVRGLECEERMIRRAEKRYGISMLRLPNPSLALYVQEGYCMSQRRALRRGYKWASVQDIARNRTGYNWVLYGHRQNESLQRRGMLNGAQGYMPDLKKAYPIWDWNAEQVYTFLKSKKIEFPFLVGYDTSGVSLTTSSLKWLKNDFPQDYEKICRQFPEAESRYVRAEIQERTGSGPGFTRQRE
jgi:3'-phosphoadenosine 5'-phosphosulfate sulfotransferase (PAPS reductase)/FAD synthetase